MRTLRLKRAAAVLAAASLLGACDRDTAPAPPRSSAQTTPETPVAGTTPAAPHAGPAATTTATDGTAAHDPLAGRTREAVNPDERTMLLLYLDLAGAQPPLSNWIEQDDRVHMAQPADKAAQRKVVKGELLAAQAAVHDIGRLRFSLNASLSDYDPSYQEFTIGALSPASELTWEDGAYKVAVQFTNGATVQHWHVPTAQAQQVRDRVNGGGASLQVVLRITGVQPGVEGGTILTQVQSYELHARDGSTLVRAQVPPGS